MSDLTYEFVLSIVTLFLFYYTTELVFLVSALFIWGSWVACKYRNLIKRRNVEGYHSLGLQWPKRVDNRVWLGMIIFLIGFAFYSFKNGPRNLQKKRVVGFTMLFSLILYPLYGLGQMLFFQSVINNRLSELFSMPLIVIFGSVFFALFHFRQCCELLVLTFFLGGFYSYFYLTYNSILPLAVFHGIFATIYYYILKGEDVIRIVLNQIYYLMDK